MFSPEVTDKHLETYQTYLASLDMFGLMTERITLKDSLAYQAEETFTSKYKTLYTRTITKKLEMVGQTFQMMELLEE